MCHCWLIGGTGIKNFLHILSGHRFTAQEKAKANKAQTQKKNLLLFIYGTGVYTRQNQTQGPLWYRGPCTAWQPTWHPAEVQLQPKTLTGTVQSKFYLSPTQILLHICPTWHGAEDAGCRQQVTSQSTPQTSVLLSTWRTAGNTVRTHDFTMEAHRLFLGVSTRGSEVSTNESKTCRALKGPALRGSHDSWHPCSAFRVQHTPVKP